jgi:hypothetical protein
MGVRLGRCCRLESRGVDLIELLHHESNESNDDSRRDTELENHAETY